MKNFTNNFKQFTSRLSARWLIMALMMLVGTSSAWGASSFASGDVIYVDVSACSWYENDGCGPGIQLNKTGNYIKMDKVADKLYTYTFAQSVTSFKLGRVKATGSTGHNSFEGNFNDYDPSSKNFFKVNSNSNGGSWGGPSFLKVYFDNSNTNWTNIYMCYGHDSYSKMNVKVNNQACGNIYYAIITDNWPDETQIAFHNSTQAETSWGSENGSITHRYGWLNGDVTHTYDITLDNANGKVFKPSKSTSKLTTGNNGKQIDAHLWGGDDAYAEETFSESMCCTTPDAPTIKINDNTSAKLCSGSAEITITGYSSTNTYTLYKGDEIVQNPTFSNGTFTVSEAGTYYVTVTTCEESPKQTTGVELEYYSAPTLTDKYSVTNETKCNNTPNNDGAISIQNGVSGVTYSLNDDDGTSWSNLSAGSYTLKATLSACSSLKDTKEITVGTTDITAFTEDVTISSTNDNVCAGSEITLTATLIPDATYTWYAADNVINDANQNTLTVIVSEETTYKVVVSKTNQGCETTKENSKTITVTENPAISSINIDRNAICSGESSIITVEGNALNFQLYTKNGDTYTPLGEKQETKTFTVNATNTYVVKAFNGKCESMSDEITLTVKPKPTISLNPTSNTVCSSTTLGNIETYVEITKTEGSEVNWYASAQGGDALAPSIALDATSYFAEATLNGCSSDRAEFTITDVLSAPTEVPNVTAPATICAGESAVLKLNNKDANYTYKVNEVKVDFTKNEYTVSPTITTDYKVSVENKCGSLSTTKTITVNPLPIISISGSEDAVLYEDVTLTATATDGATVKWYEGAVKKGEGLTYVVTSETATSKTVTAKAFSGDCVSEESHTVIFSAENCESTTTTVTKEVIDEDKMEIWCREETGSNAGANLECYAWDNNQTLIFGGWNGQTTNNTETYDGKTYRVWKINNISSEYTLPIKVIFSYQEGNSTYQTDDLNTGVAGHKYTYWFKKDGNGNSNKGGIETVFKKGDGYDDSEIKKTITTTTTTPAPITAPAVKTVSATSEQGSGVVEFTGQIIKTGCAATSKIYYGYQFKKADEEWPTTGVEASNTPVEGKLIPLTNASETALYYQFSANVENLEDVDYHFRAYIINGYDFTNGNYDKGVYYGLDKLVTVSTVKAPVTTAKIQLTESDGTPVDNDKKYCVGETAYIMVDSDVRYTEISWKSQQGVDIVQTRLMNMYQFVVKGNDNIVVLLSNKHNVTPAESKPIEVYTFADPVLPTVSLNKVSICSNDAVGATVKLTNVVKGQTYQLYQQIDNGDGTFTEKAIGSAKTQVEDVTDKTELVLHTLTNTAATGKYFVKTYTAQCQKNLAATQPFTFTVVDVAEVFISIDPATATTTPWMPAKFTVSASDKYTLNVTKGNPAEAATEAEVSQNSNNVSVKIPLPEDATGGEGQYENVVFPDGATTQYTITATLLATGGDDNPCATPANATITLVPYVEECTIGH